MRRNVKIKVQNAKLWLIGVVLFLPCQPVQAAYYVVTGDITPAEVKGNYFYGGESNGRAYYKHADVNEFIWWTGDYYAISNSYAVLGTIYWLGAGTVTGEYAHGGLATGTARVTADPFTRTYIRPIDHNDNTDWTNIEYAYDANEYTYAYSNVASSRLILNCKTADQNGLSVKIKTYCYEVPHTTVIEVYYNAEWHTVYNGVLTNNTYEVKDIPGISYPVCIEKIGIINTNGYELHVLDVQVHTAWPSAGAASQPGSYWYDDETAYLAWAIDDNDSNSASSVYYFSIAEGDLNTAAVALEFTPQAGCVNDTECFRVKARYTDGLPGDMKVDYNDGTDWHNIYDGIADNSLLEVNFTAMPMPVKFRVWPTDMNSTNQQFYIDEFDFGNEYYNRTVLPEKAYSPIPGDDVNNVSITADLNWTAGSGAASHDVYFGTASPGATQGNQEGTTYDTNTMGYSTVYYWRIDEKNENGTTTGDVWSFTTEAATVSGNRGSFFFE